MNDCNQCRFHDHGSCKHPYFVQSIDGKWIVMEASDVRQEGKACGPEGRLFEVEKLLANTPWFVFTVPNDEGYEVHRKQDSMNIIAARDMSFEHATLLVAVLNGHTVVQE